MRPKRARIHLKYWERIKSQFLGQRIKEGFVDKLLRNRNHVKGDVLVVRLSSGLSV